MVAKNRNVEWFKFFIIELYMLVIPTFIFYLIGLKYPAALNFSYYFIVYLFIVQSTTSYLYSFNAFKRKRFKELPATKHVSVPKTTFIISAYLPGEIEVVENTILNILEHVERPKNGIELILTYNTPQMEGIEPRLRELAYKWPELILANAYNSKGKSENLNYALELASGEMIVLFDADHLVSPDCLARAWRWLDEGYDAVQGRCKIRNGDRCMLSALIEVEFETMYGVSHYAKSKVFDSALFGGSNGYWRSEAIKQIKFDPGKLTEDIDSTLRALLSGKRIVHDRSIISSELAPETLGALWFQRKRWAQGWFQCALNYQIPVWASRYFTIQQKCMWTTLLIWRIFYDIVIHFLAPIVFAFWMTRGRISVPMNGFIWFSLFFTLGSGYFETLAAYKNASLPKAPGSRYLYYALGSFFYTFFKNTIQVVAIREELLGKQEWVISRRKG
ncbi:MAG: glycosyltransferase family 2 protein [Candidatus Omnitrophica bacterium]|nr:glycosyltransferase family 2 protein [Candidatus Omnitrophota bacterium]